MHMIVVGQLWQEGHHVSKAIFSNAKVSRLSGRRDVACALHTCFTPLPHHSAYRTSIQGMTTNAIHTARLTVSKVQPRARW